MIPHWPVPTPIPERMIGFVTFCFPHHLKRWLPFRSLKVLNGECAVESLCLECKKRLTLRIFQVINF